jgi:hypothetical protein
MTQCRGKHGPLSTEVSRKAIAFDSQYFSHGAAGGVSSLTICSWLAVQLDGTCPVLAEADQRGTR